MDYPLENLGPERFQELCQALLLKEYPKVQCFPVAQPDGGRDAVSYFSPDEEKSIVFQVKFVRKPLAEKEPHKWLLGHLRAELPKILQLRKKGATQYVLITNVPGTAHLDTGSIDRANALITQETGIESYCWWRDDINRRLDSNWSLKWSYPEVMTGPDFLRAIIEQGVSEHTERRMTSVKAFLRTQYVADEEVRFKQVELHNKLFDLFIDVPIRFDDESADQRQFRAFQEAVTGYLHSQATPVNVPDPHRFHRTLVSSGRDLRFAHEGQEIGAAAFLLSKPAQELLPLVVIEGAPGQGKSTITQFLCQVHRTRLLNEDNGQLKLIDTKDATSFRLPFKVDLRDYATWLTRRNPFSTDLNNAAPHGWHRSLESFLAALVSEYSGGTEFSTNDLLAVFKPSSVLLVLDGLDEVADITRRKEIVDEIVKGVQRLQETSASLQVIITSRPAAFANSPGMPHSKYPYLQLASLSRPSIMEYADRWMKAKRLEAKHTAEFRKILKDKLDQPHLRDLARNPMQLAILLTLILTRGSSLPDKRTALYDFYIDLFFSREAEKSEVVRNHRQLLIDIHGFLGWLLHSESELGDARPSISQERLHQVVSQYLAREGHDVSLAEMLFTGMVERVVALVSRIQGTFEFEVQPLREYFAAYFLYDTAPQSSAGKEKSGSRPDRFDALARNFYWLNVTRFFAGRYSKGELPSLIERLEELASSKHFAQIGHPRLLAATLLGDWVFTQSPRSVKDAVTLTLGDGKLRYLTATGSMRFTRRSSQSAIVLPPKCGRDELMASCFSFLKSDLQRDFEDEILEIMRTNLESGNDLLPIWTDFFSKAKTDDVRTIWLRRGLELGILGEFTFQQFEAMLGKLMFSRQAVSLFYNNNKTRDILNQHEEMFDVAIDAILALDVHSSNGVSRSDPLGQLHSATDAFRLSLSFRTRDPISLEQVLIRHGLNRKLAKTRSTTTSRRFKQYTKCVELNSITEEQLKLPASEWAISLTPWDSICEGGRIRFGERWAFTCLANTAAGIRSKTENCSDFSNLLDHSLSLCKRVRYARLRSSNPQWWSKQFDLADDDADLSLLLLVLFTWAKKKTLTALVGPIEKALKGLPEKKWQNVFNSSRHRPFRAEDRREVFSDPGEIPAKLSDRLACVFAARSTGAAEKVLFESHFDSPERTNTIGLEFVMSNALDSEHAGSASWKPNLNLIKRAYALGCYIEPRSTFQMWRELESSRMPLEVAQQVADSPLDYPGYLLAMAEVACRAVVTENVVAVSAIAQRETWF